MKMNGEQQAAQAGALGLQRAGGAAAQSRPVPQGKLAELVNSYEKNNARLNELILIQRDNVVRLTGINPVDEPPQTNEKVPEITGIMAELERAVYYQNELNTKLNALTDAWAAV